MMMGSKKVLAKYERMSALELNAEAAEFGKEMVITELKPFTTKERVWRRRVCRQPCRSLRASVPERHPS